jgi:restriction system protein
MRDQPGKHRKERPARIKAATFEEWDDSGFPNPMEGVLPATPSSAPAPTDFEAACATALERVGWKVRRTGRSGDQGVDLIAERAGRTVVLQCKLYSGPVGNSAVQQVFAGKAFEDAHVAVVVSNSTYTRSACDLAAKNGVLLLHFDQLSSLAELATKSGHS